MNVLTKLGAAAVLAAGLAAGASAGETVEQIVVTGQRPSWSLPVVLEQPTEAQIRMELDFNLELEPVTPAIAKPAIEVAIVERNLG